MKKPRMRFIAAFAGLATAGLSVGWLAQATAPGDIPSHETVRSQWRPSEAVLLDRHGRLLQGRRLDFGVRRFAWTELEAVSPALVKAVVRGEDRRFWDHGGVDWRAVGAAAWSNLNGPRLRGASTISMQVAALLDPALLRRDGRRTVLQKIRQARAARLLEARWTKGQILEAYLNLVGYRAELQGVAAVSWLRLGKAPDGLTLDESLVLAALLPSPGAGRKALERRARALAGKMDPPLALDGLADALGRVTGPEQGHFPGPNLAPHLATRLLWQPGERLRTSLDGDLQAFVHDLLASRLDGLKARNVRDGAAVVLDNASGQVLAYVASAGPHSLAPMVDGAVARRQAGSTLKPFLYALAIEERYLTAAAMLDDSPVRLETVNGLYVPQNYDREFKGPVSVRTALGNSLNVPAVRALAVTGVENFRAWLHRLGYAGIDRDGEYYGFALALGAPEVSLMEQVAAYATLANGGSYREPGFLSGRAAPAHQLIDPRVAFIIGDLLSDRSARVLTFGMNNSLSTPFWSAVKTGTSKDMRDNWAIGFSDRYTVGVWVGNFEGDSMRGVSGMTGAAPIWRGIMGYLHGDRPSRAPQPPEGLSRMEVRYEPALEAPRAEWFLAGTETPVIRLTGNLSTRPRIVHPAQGTVIALDPDIPPARQALLLQTEGEGAGWSLRLNGRVLDGVPLWHPETGRHRLELLDDAGRMVDAVTFTVRRGDGS